MNSKKDSFVLGRIKSLKFALLGIFKLATTEHSIITQLLMALLVTVLGWYMHISREEWMIQTLAIGLVLSIEGLNTAVEKIADFIHPDYHNKIGFIKDIAAGAVAFAAIVALIIGLIIYLPKFI